MKLPTQNSFFILLIIATLGCSSIQELTTLQKPTASIIDYKLTGLSLDKADLMFDVEIQNPNPVALSLENYSYDFRIEENSFLQGTQTSNTSIQPDGESTLQIPITIEFDELVSSIKSVLNEDEIAYSFDATLGTQVPILGLVELPITQKGSIPMIKIPIISLSSFKIDQLSFTKASVLVGLEIENPNAFGMDLNNLNYSINIDGLDVVDGSISQAIQIEENERALIEIPLDFNLMQLGVAAYQMLHSKNPISYSIDGTSNLGLDMPFFNPSTFDFNRNGTINISN